MSRSTEVTGLLAEVPLFAECSKRDLQAVARHADVVEVSDGSAIVRQGSTGDAFYVLLEGRAVVRRNGRKVAELGAGEYFGELALLDPAPRDADVVAQGAATVLRLRARDFRQALEDAPQMNARLLAGLARRLRSLDRRV